MSKIVLGVILFILIEIMILFGFSRIYKAPEGARTGVPLSTVVQDGFVAVDIPVGLSPEEQSAYVAIHEYLYYEPTSKLDLIDRLMKQSGFELDAVVDILNLVDIDWSEQAIRASSKMIEQSLGGSGGMDASEITESFLEGYLLSLKFTEDEIAKAFKSMDIPQMIKDSTDKLAEYQQRHEEAIESGELEFESEVSEE